MKRNMFGEPIFSMEDAADVPSHIEEEIAAAEISLMNDSDPSEGWAVELRDEDGETLGYAHNLQSEKDARLFCSRAGIPLSAIEIVG